MGSIQLNFLAQPQVPTKLLFCLRLKEKRSTDGSVLSVKEGINLFKDPKLMGLKWNIWRNGLGYSKRSMNFFVQKINQLILESLLW